MSIIITISKTYGIISFTYNLKDVDERLYVATHSSHWITLIITDSMNYVSYIRMMTKNILNIVNVRAATFEDLHSWKKNIT